MNKSKADKTMKKIYLFLLLVILINPTYSQTNYTDPKNDELKNKIDEYLRLMKKADVYEAITENELQKVDYLKTQAHLYFDSAKAISKKAKRDMSNADNISRNSTFFLIFRVFLYQKMMIRL